MIFKKSHVRVLAIVAGATPEGGIKVEHIPPLLLLFYKKNATVEVTEKILRTLFLQGMMHSLDSGEWRCKERGMITYGGIKEFRPQLLLPTRTPEAPVLAWN